MGGKTKKTAAINIRVPPELKEAAERAAAKDRRSLTSLIENPSTGNRAANRKARQQAEAAAPE